MSRTPNFINREQTAITTKWKRRPAAEPGARTSLYARSEGRKFVVCCAGKRMRPRDFTQISHNEH